MLAHARALLDANDHTTVIQEDLRHPDAILSDPQVTEMIDFNAPVAILAVAILHFISDADDPWAAIARFRDAMPSGSYLVLTHGADAPHIKNAAQTYDQTPSGAATVRSEDDIRSFFDGFELVAPGLVSVTECRPNEAGQPADSDSVVLYAGVGKKP